MAREKWNFYDLLCYFPGYYLKLKHVFKTFLKLEQIQNFQKFAIQSYYFVALFGKRNYFGFFYSLISFYLQGQS